MQMLIFSLNVPSRWGCQAPFTNFTFDWNIPEDMKNEQAIVKGIKQLEVLINVYKEKFKEILGKELSFELKEKKDEKKNENIENEKKLAT